MYIELYSGNTVNLTLIKHSEKVVVAVVTVVYFDLLYMPLAFPLLLRHALVLYVAVLCKKLVECEASLLLGF